MRFLQRLVLVLLAAVVLAAVGAPACRADPVVAAAGDIACDPDDSGFNGGLGTSTRCRQRYTSDRLVRAGLARVLALGDNQYDSGSLADFRVSYDPSWGRVKSMTRPVLGNHEGYGTGYFDYFNGLGAASGPAGERPNGYYSFDLGGWHVIALNSNCSRVSCSAGSTQERWLRADLEANPISARWPTGITRAFSSGHGGDSTFMQAIWRDLYDAGVELVLSGHSQDYERFAPQDGAGRLDRMHGVREFVVGTGGAFFTELGTPRPNSEVRQNATFGVLKLTLHGTSYDWRFVPEAGKTFTDSGSDLCHPLSILFGRHTPGGSFSPMSVNVKRVSPFVAFFPATVVRIHAYIDGRGASSGSQVLRGVLYGRAPDGGPGPLLGGTFQFTVPAGMTARWVELYMAPPVRLNPGVYWLGIHSGTKGGVARFAWDARSNSRRFNIDGYADWPSDPFGSALMDDQQMSIFASGSC